MDSLTAHPHCWEVFRTAYEERDHNYVNISINCNFHLTELLQLTLVIHIIQIVRQFIPYFYYKRIIYKCVHIYYLV